MKNIIFFASMIIGFVFISNSAYGLTDDLRERMRMSASPYPHVVQMLKAHHVAKTYTEKLESKNKTNSSSKAATKGQVTQAANNAQTSQQASKSIKDIIGVGSLKEGIDAANGLITLLNNTSIIAQSTYHYFYPAEPSEEQRRNEQVRTLENEGYAAEREANNCLVNHCEDLEKDKDGMPCACKDVMKAYAKIFGREATMKKKSEFKDLF